MTLGSIMNRAAHALPVVALAFSAASFSNDANALTFKCYEGPEQVAAMKKAMGEEGLTPVLKFYQGGSERGSDVTTWRENIIVMNPQTRVGHKLGKSPDGSFCVSSNLKNIQLYSNDVPEPDASVYMSVPGADAPTTGVNRFIFAAARKGELPMLKADESIPTLKLESVTYVTGTKAGTGSVLRASKDGSLMADFTKVIPAANQYPAVKFGIEYTASAKEILGKKDRKFNALTWDIAGGLRMSN